METKLFLLEILQYSYKVLNTTSGFAVNSQGFHSITTISKIRKVSVQKKWKSILPLFFPSPQDSLGNLGNILSECVFFLVNPRTLDQAQLCGEKQPFLQLSRGRDEENLSENK